MKKLIVDLQHTTYPILLERGCIQNINKHYDLNKRVFILTDENIPQVWIDQVTKQCPTYIVHKVAAGEQSKGMTTYETCLQAMLSFQMTRKDVLVALGGGVIGDLGGFLANSYMRGIDFISIPTTTLSQIDSSIGGKVAVNLGEVKNIVGAFYHPKAVFIDFDTLDTLPKRHVINGLIEAIKAGLIHDASLFSIFEKEDWQDHIEKIIYQSLCMKKWVVEQDEKEAGIRKTLNFGHTIGHGIEAYYHLDTYLHGECVAMGMLYFIEEESIKQRVLSIYQRMGIIPTCPIDNKAVYDITVLDKKAFDDSISVVKVKEIGKAYIEDIKKEDILMILERGIT